MAANATVQHHTAHTAVVLLKLQSGQRDPETGDEPSDVGGQHQRALAVGMRSLETSEGLWSKMWACKQLESQVATGSLENEVGLENKANLGSEVWYTSAACSFLVVQGHFKIHMHTYILQVGGVGCPTADTEVGPEDAFVEHLTKGLRLKGIIPNHSRCSLSAQKVERTRNMSSSVITQGRCCVQTAESELGMLSHLS
ncbi:hypothetical protein EXN66_Car018768 [Channa argus]|uniref:Uncharacterized protein n=1 Tax=Channa argus TaxID=215402 RepID=A0A6G1QK50_CHAAH|nr:hypothetical protein EXN66_Car018768 [Channa argus]